MKQLLIRRENLLLLLPVFLFFYHEAFIGNSALDIHLHDTYFVIDTSFLFFFLFVFLIIPYLFHFLLRRKGMGNRQILLAHVIITLILASWLYIFFKQNFVLSLAGAPRRYYDISDAHKYSFFGNKDSTYFSIAMSLCLIQVLFIIYCILTLFKRLNKR